MITRNDIADRGLITLLLLSVLCFAQKQSVVAAPTAPNPPAWFQIADNGEQIRVHIAKSNRTNVLLVKQVPPFDENDVGEKANPATDHRFSPRAIYDRSRNLIYFSVYNLATAGNANADRALFSYSIETGAIARPLSVREMSVSYGILALSPDGRYLAFSDGGHGGMCADTLGITRLNLETKAEIDRVFLPAGTIGDIDFVAWTGLNTFKYQENTWRNREDCLNSPDKPTVAEKVHTVN